MFCGHNFKLVLKHLLSTLLDNLLSFTIYKHEPYNNPQQVPKANNL
jgi:hypothetical protein